MRLCGHNIYPSSDIDGGRVVVYAIGSTLGMMDELLYGASFRQIRNHSSVTNIGTTK